MSGQHNNNERDRNARQYIHDGEGNQNNVDNVENYYAKIENYYANPPEKRSEPLCDLLDEVKKEVNYRLDKSLHNKSLINLGKELQPDKVRSPWDAEIKSGIRPDRALLLETSIVDVFERADIANRLLILGEPGSGKTTHLLDLAKSLIDRAEADPNNPVPVLLNLSEQTNPQQKIQDWVIAELRSKYRINRNVDLSKWLEERKLLLLLDKLDRVRPDPQSYCLQVINEWLQSSYCPSSVVVCCRRENYDEYYPEQLKLNGAIYLLELTDAQMQNRLIEMELSHLWQSCQVDTAIHSLLKNPFFLSIAILSKPKFSQDQWRQATSTEERLKLLFDAYVREMLSRPLKNTFDPKYKLPDDRQTQKWLVFLARQLQRESKTEFLIERIQPSWLQTSQQKWIYQLFFFLIGGLLFGLFFHDSIEAMLLSGLLGGIAISHWMAPFSGETEEITLVEAYSWSWRKAISISPGMIFATIYGLLLGLISVLANECGLLCGLTNGLIGALAGGLPVGLFGGIEPVELEKKLIPNQGIWRSAVNALIAAMLISGLFIGFGFILFLLYMSKNFNNPMFINRLFIALLSYFVGVVGVFLNAITEMNKVRKTGWAINSGIACIKHFVLRLILYFSGSIPWNYKKFLDYASERDFLESIGGRYRFIHELLQEHFAKMEEYL